MLTISCILALAGLFLVYLEFFLPGAIMGIGGAVLIFSSLIHFACNDPTPLEFLIFFLATILGLFITIKIALSRVKASGKKGTIFLNSDQEGFQASLFSEEMVGKKGIAASDLRPSGRIYVDDQYLQATSKSGYIEKGTSIVVTGGEGARLKVKPLK